MKAGRQGGRRRIEGRKEGKRETLARLETCVAASPFSRFCLGVATRSSLSSGFSSPSRMPPVPTADWDMKDKERPRLFHIKEYRSCAVEAYSPSRTNKNSSLATS
jgi:hypothetical protein